MLRKMIERRQAEKAAVKFANAILDTYWPECNDIDGADIQERAVKAGIMIDAPGGYDPDKHGESEYDAAPGDPWYIAHPGLKYGTAKMTETRLEAICDILMKLVIFLGGVFLGALLNSH